MNTLHSDRRKRDRRSTSIYLRFMDNRTGELIGDLADISHDGFMLESFKPIPLNTEFSFRIDLSPEISTKQSIIFTARSRWSQTDPIDRRMYDVGFEVTKIDPDDTQVFQQIFDRYGSNATNRNLGHA
jgi:hypothetical protein